MRQLTEEFLVTESSGKWSVRPTLRRVMRQLTLFFFGSVFMIAGGVWMDVWPGENPLAWWRDSHLFTILGFMTSAVFMGCGIWIWYMRNTQLSIDLRTGVVTFGSRQLCGPGAVKSVWLRRDSNPDDSEPYSVEFQLINGTTVCVPSPSFVRIDDFEQACELAEQMAARLNVVVWRDF